MKRYLKIVRDFNSLEATNKKYAPLEFIYMFIKDIVVLSFPIVAALIVDAVVTKSFKLAFIYIFLSGICYLLHNIICTALYKMMDKNYCYTYTKLQEKIIASVGDYEESFTKKITLANLVNTTATDTRTASQTLYHLFGAIGKLVSLTIIIVVLTTINVTFGLISLICTILYIIILNFLNKNRDYHLKKQRKDQDNITDFFNQVVDGNKEVNSFDMERDLDNYFESRIKFWEKDYFNKRKYVDLTSTILPLLMFSVKIVVYIILISNLLKGGTNIGLFILIVGYFERIETSIDKFREAVNELSILSVNIERLCKTIKYKNKYEIIFGKNENDNIFGDVAFEDVSFTYENDKILNDVSFEIKAKSLTTIVGKSGSGKSTVFRLLLRFYQQDKGNIYIDGLDIKEYSKEVYATNVGTVNQKPFIFNMSIRDNLSLVDKNTNNQVEACKRVGIHDFIMSLPKGYNTVLKEDATDISGGQKQLIAFARILLSQSEILLFDEVTSALDPNTTKHVMKLLKDLKKDHTVIYITHKPLLMKIADQIIVIDKGKVVGNGKHKQLLNNIYYKRLQK